MNKLDQEGLDGFDKLFQYQNFESYQSFGLGTLAHIKTKTLKETWLAAVQVIVMQSYRDECPNIW